MDTIHIPLFKNKSIRNTLHNEERWFSIIDIVSVLAKHRDPRSYWQRLKRKLVREGVDITISYHKLKLPASDGSMRATDCANIEEILRIAQSISSAKAEPVKRWMAQTAHDQLEEIESPELAIKRTRRLYKLKGHAMDWIEKRMQGIIVREELTDEWQRRGVHDSSDYELLTNEMSRAIFGLTPGEYKRLKGLDERDSLRDHMDDFELLFSVLGERAAIEIHRAENSRGVEKLKEDAIAGGDIANGAMERLEQRLGRSIVTEKNFKKEKDKFEEV